MRPADRGPGRRVHAASRMRREQDVLAALQRIGVDAERAPSRLVAVRADALAQQLGVVADRRRRRGERLRGSRAAGRRCCPACRSRSRRRRAAARCARRPGPSPPGPASRARPAAPRSRPALSPLRRASSSLIHGRKSSGAQSGNVSSRLPRSPLGSMTIAGNAVDRRLFEQREAEAGLAAAGHADADGVRHQVLGVVEQQVARGACRRPGRTAGRGRRRRASRSPRGRPRVRLRPQSARLTRRRPSRSARCSRRAGRRAGS